MGRDVQSNYLIIMLQEDDVQDLFLGTGLGGNSYAIIEQGIISSLVGAKPEELEVMLKKLRVYQNIREKEKQNQE